MKIKTVRVVIIVIGVLVAVGFGVYYGSNHLGGNDVVVGYSSKYPEAAKDDARRTLDSKYSSYDVVAEFGDDGGTSVETSTDYSGEKRTYKKGTWKYTIRVKNAQPKKN